MADARFARSSRLLEARQFKAVFDDARLRVSAPQLLFLARPNDLGYPRIGLVISKKSCPLATERNRIKRLLREAFRRRHDLGGLDIVVLSRRGIADLDNGAVTQLVTQSWNRLLKRSRNAPPASSADAAGA